MPIPDASVSDLQRWLGQGMHEALHWFPEDVSPERLAAVLVGMANGRGGTVLIGISPRAGHIQGVSAPAEAVDRVFQAALLVQPPLVLPMPQRVETLSGLVLILTIPPGLPHVFSLDGRYLGREGRQSNPLAARQLRTLLLERGVVQYDTQILEEACLADLDPQRIRLYVANLQGIDPTLVDAPEKVLLQRGCLKNQAGQLVPTAAGMLLFGLLPQQWLPGAMILASRFVGTSFQDQFIKQELRGTLPDQLHLAEAFVRDSLPQQVSLESFERHELPVYPPGAVRELLVNAVAHRDYSIAGDMIHLNIFADRIEVHSPGGLPGPVTLHNLLQARFSRNPVISQLLSDLGFVERLGYGLDRVVQLMRQHRLRPPRFEEQAGTFRVTLYAAQPEINPAPDPALLAGMDLNPRQTEAFGYLLRHKRITSREYQELCPNVHAETLRRDLAEMVQSGVLIKVGDKRATYYILKKPASD